MKGVCTSKGIRGNTGASCVINNIIKNERYICLEE